MVPAYRTIEKATHIHRFQLPALISARGTSYRMTNDRAFSSFAGCCSQSTVCQSAGQRKKNTSRTFFSLGETSLFVRKDSSGVRLPRLGLRKHQLAEAPLPKRGGNSPLNYGGSGCRTQLRPFDASEIQGTNCWLWDKQSQLLQHQVPTHALSECVWNWGIPPVWACLIGKIDINHPILRDPIRQTPKNRISGTSRSNCAAMIQGLVGHWNCAPQ